jgi:hypothetical protein
MKEFNVALPLNLAKEVVRSQEFRFDGLNGLLQSQLYLPMNNTAGHSQSRQDQDKKRPQSEAWFGLCLVSSQCLLIPGSLFFCLPLKLRHTLHPFKPITAVYGQFSF